MTNSIEKTVDLKAPIARVWRALTDWKEFGSWFGVELEAPFVAGQRVAGQFAMGETKFRGEFYIDRIDREAGVFAYHWHPHALDPARDYRSEPMTIVTFAVSETPAGTHLVITETGFDAIPADRRDAAYHGNTRGWAFQADRIGEYLAKAS